MKPALQPCERRAFGRVESHVDAVAVAGRQLVPCIVRNFSEHGALLEFAEPFPAATTFKLRIEAKQVEALCEVRHRNGNQLGIRFLGGTIASALQRDFARQIAAEARPNDRGAPLATQRPVALVKSTTGADLRRLLHVGVPSTVQGTS